MILDTDAHCCTLRLSGLGIHDRQSMTLPLLVGGNLCLGPSSAARAMRESEVRQ